VINNNDEYICNAHLKQSSNAPLLHYRTDVIVLSIHANIWMDDVSLSSVCRLFQMTAADTANNVVRITVLVQLRCFTLFWVAWELLCESLLERESAASRPVVPLFQEKFHLTGEHLLNGFSFLVNF